MEKICKPNLLILLEIRGNRFVKKCAVHDALLEIAFLFVDFYIRSEIMTLFITD